MHQDWDDALAEKWPEYAEGLGRNLARARIGAKEAPSPDIRREMASHVKVLEKLLSERLAEPKGWRPRHEFKIGHVFMKKKAGRDYGRAEIQGILGQVDLLVEAAFPFIYWLHAPGAVTVPNAYLPDELQEDNTHRGSDSEKWGVKAIPADFGLMLREQPTTYFMVFAPVPCNYQKVLKNVGLIEPWLVLSGENQFRNAKYGIVTDDLTLAKIVVSQGSVAFYLVEDSP